MSIVKNHTVGQSQAERQTDTQTIARTLNPHTEPQPAEVQNTFDIGSTSSDSLNGGRHELLVRLRDVGLELSQNGGNVAFGRQVGEDFQLQKSNVKRVRVGADEERLEIRLEQVFTPY